MLTIQRTSTIDSVGSNDYIAHFATAIYISFICYILQGDIQPCRSTVLRLNCIIFDVCFFLSSICDNRFR